MQRRALVYADVQTRLGICLFRWNSVIDDAGNLKTHNSFM
jgi:hypothetical protein